jgi:hypothetical protein
MEIMEASVLGDHNVPVAVKSSKVKVQNGTNIGTFHYYLT